jgi:hypothetical protein
MPPMKHAAPDIDFSIGESSPAPKPPAPKRHNKGRAPKRGDRRLKSPIERATPCGYGEVRRRGYDKALLRSGQGNIDFTW